MLHAYVQRFDVMCLGKKLETKQGLKKPEPIPEDTTDDRWKYFNATHSKK